MKTTETGAGSLLVKERRACVGWPLTSFMPKISEEGKEVCTLMSRVGERGGDLTSSEEACEEGC